MVLAPQTARAWKLATAITTVGTGFYCVFVVDYGNHDHVFSDLQRWYRHSVDKHLLGIQIEQNNQRKMVKPIKHQKGTHFDSSAILTTGNNTKEQ